MTIKMSTLLKFEELGQFLLAIFLFTNLDYDWWVFPVCILLPDFSMLGYIVNPKFGAYLYNFFHHKLMAIILLILGTLVNLPVLILVGIILFGHAAMDRIFGYGLKYTNRFKNTHLGEIGN